MTTVDTLCMEMARSGRPLTKRAARDWWTKGLLPRPRRRSLGRAGFESYWPSASVVTQAVAAHDLLTRQARTDATLVRLWLMGFPIDFDRLRPAWLALIAKDELPVSAAEENGRLPEDAVGDIVAAVVRTMTHDRGEIFEHLSTLFSEGLNVFFGTNEEIEGYGLAAAAKASMRHLHPELPGAQKFSWSDEDCIWALGVLKDWCSLPAQREIIAAATEHELARARRLLQIGLGAFGRKRESLQVGSHWPFVIVFGRVAIPVLIKLLRQPYAHHVVETALQFSRQLRQRGAEVVHAFYQPDAILSSEPVAQSVTR